MQTINVNLSLPRTFQNFTNQVVVAIVKNNTKNRENFRKSKVYKNREPPNKGDPGEGENCNRQWEIG
jgi:hypothetical protein